MRILFLVLSALILGSQVNAATMDAGHRKGLVDGCVQTYQSMPVPPPPIAATIPALKHRSDPVKLREFCSCQTDVYHSQIPQADYDQWLKEIRSGNSGGPASTRIRAQAVPRAEIADNQCDARMSRP